MEAGEKTTVKHCLYCERNITGRKGKIYCNVDCKNNYNSRKKAELKAKGHPGIPEVLRIIKNNYQVLLPYRDEISKTPSQIFQKSVLLSKGLNPNFFTGTYEFPPGTIWYCCFDFCWIAFDAEYYKISHQPQMMSTK